MSITKKEPEKSIERSEEEIIRSIEEKVGNLAEKEQLDEKEDNLADEVVEETEVSIVDEVVQESTEDITVKLQNRQRKVITGIVVALCTLLIIYLSMTQYYTHRFFFGSKVNSIDVSGKTIEDVMEVMKSEIRDYTLTIKERGNKSEKIKASDVSLEYNFHDNLKEFKDSQKPFKWILAYLVSEDFEITLDLSYDEKLLRKKIDELACFDRKNIIEPKNPSFKYQDNKYVIIDEIAGNKVDKEILYSYVADAILKKETEIDLESTGCYIKPEYNSKSRKVTKTRDELNKYVSSIITYTFGEKKEILDGSKINKWITIDEDFLIRIDEGKVSNYISSLAKTYNTVGKQRSFISSSGNVVSIGGGDYGWIIDEAKEREDLIRNIMEGRSITKEPIYRQTAFSYGDNDIGDTYVEINLEKQYLWFYKDGSIIVEGSIVTGNVQAGYSTPKGIYRLKYKQRDTVLRGADYASPVTFWMPFNGGIGIHDANWRSVFGGNIYRTNGSHGCINSPYNVASAIFNNIEKDTPVICY